MKKDKKIGTRIERIERIKADKKEYFFLNPFNPLYPLDLPKDRDKLRSYFYFFYLPIDREMELIQRIKADKKEYFF